MLLFPLPIPLSGFAQKDGRLARNKCVQVTTARWQRRGERTGALLSLASCARRHGRSRSQGGPRRPTRARHDETGRVGAAKARADRGGGFRNGGCRPRGGHQRMGAGLFASARIMRAPARPPVPPLPALRRAGGDGAPAGIDRPLRRRTKVVRAPGSVRAPLGARRLPVPNASSLDCHGTLNSPSSFVVAWSWLGFARLYRLGSTCMMARVRHRLSCR